MADTEYTEDGFPVLLATRAPGQVAAQPNPSGIVIMRGARSGNPKADPVTGRFAGGKPGRRVEGQGADVVVTQQTRQLPQGTTAAQLEKRADLVRWAARSLAQVNPAAAKAFLEKFPTVDTAQVNIDLFVRDIREQRIQDCVDIINHQRNGGMIKVYAPGRVTKKVFNSLDNGEMIRVAKRLEGMGWDPEDISKNVIGSMAAKGRRAALEQVYGERKPKK